MNIFKGKNERVGILIVLAGMVAMPGLVLGQTNNPPHSPGDDPSYNIGDGATTEPIDTANGNNYFSENRIFVPGPGVPLSVDLKYQSITGNPEGRLGKGWVHSYEWSLDVQSGEVILYTGSGEKKVFEEDGSGGYLSPDSNNWTLNASGGGYEVGMPGGMGFTFDSSGRLDFIHDAWGNGVECAYGTNGCLETASHSNGRQIFFNNDWDATLGEWRIASIAVQVGESLAFGYNGDGQLVQVIEQVGEASYTSSYQYADGFLTNKVNGASFDYDFGYISVDGTLNGKGTSLEVDGYYEHTVAYDPGIADVTYARRGEEQVFRYSRSGGALSAKYGPADSVQNVQQRGIRYSYATSAGIDKTEETLYDNTANETFSEWMLHDDAHNLTNYAVSYNSTNPVQQFSMEYDPVWQLPSSIVDAEGHRTEIVYTNGLPLIVKTFYDASNSYDSTFAYTTNGLPLAITNANGHVISFSYDAMDNLATISAELGPIATNTYDALGFVKTMEILSESENHTGRITQYDRDAKGQILQTTFADGRTASAAYNALGYLTNSVDRAGRTTDYTYAPTEKLTSVTRYLQQGSSNVPVRTSYDRDEQVNVLRITEPRGRYVESYQLDIQDRVTSVTNIDNQVLSIDYGVGDFIRQITRFDGSTITNTHDTAGRISTSTYNPGSASPVAISYSYWLDGELKVIADSTSATTNTYDALNRLTNQVVQIGSLQSKIGNAFDPVGNLTNSVVSVGGSQVSATTYAYDAAERLKAISATDAGAFAYTYNPASGAIATISNTVSGITTSYAYDLMDRTTNIAYTASNGSLIRSFGYEYDAASMITKKVQALGNGQEAIVDYIYDSLDRLVHESTSGSVSSAYSVVYNYDLAGNRTSKIFNGWETTYLHTNGNRLASSTSEQATTHTLFVSGIADELIGTDNRWGELWLTNLTSGATVFPSVNGNTFFATIPATTSQTNALHVAIRDRAGNMGYATKDFWAATPNGTNETKNYAYDDAGCLTNLNGVSLEWDERYRLKSVDDASSFVEYGYDVLNRRTIRIEGSTTNYYVYNGNQVAADLDGSGALLRTYVWGNGIDNLLAMTIYGATATNTYYAIKDHQNTVIALTDESGSVVENYEYDAFGKTRVFDADGMELTTSTYGNRYTFQGREIDWTTGLHYFRARWYDPSTGRWISKDPKGIAGGLNLYVAFGNNPVNFIDPMGLAERGGIAAGGISNLSNSPVTVYSPESGSATVGPWSSSPEGHDWDSVESPAGSGNWKKIGPGQNVIGPNGKIDSNFMRMLDKLLHPERYKPGAFPIPPRSDEDC